MLRPGLQEQIVHGIPSLGEAEIISKSPISVTKEYPPLQDLDESETAACQDTEVEA